MCVDNRQQLNRDCDDLISRVKTREDFLKQAEEVVDSTTDVEDTPPKKTKLDRQSQKAKQGKPKGFKQSITLTKAEAAKKRAAELFAFHLRDPVVTNSHPWSYKDSYWSKRRKCKDS